MARWYVLQGPHATREQAEGAYAAMDRNHTRLRVAKLRDRTGPSLRERVAELEAAEKDAAGRAGASLREIGDRVIAMCDSRLVDMGKRLAALESALGEPVCVGCGGSIGHHHAPDQGGCSGWFPTVREHLARVEVQAFQRDGTRPGAPTPTAPEPIAHVPTESAGADGARLALSEAEMAAELRRERWTTLWVAPTLRIYSAWIR